VRTPPDVNRSAIKPFASCFEVDFVSTIKRTVTEGALSLLVFTVFAS